MALDFNTTGYLRQIGSRPLIAAAVAAILAVPAHAQAPEATALQQQIEKVVAGQESLRKEMQAVQRQLQELRTLILQARSPQPAAAPTQPALPAELSTDGAASKGTADAKLTVIEFSDFECPFCARHAQQTLDQLDREYIATGKVRYVFRHFPLERIHPLALKAGEAAACAGAQGKFWEMHDLLFANQKALRPDDLVKHAQTLGLNDAPFKTCLAGQLTDRVRQDLAIGAQAGVGSTPTFFVGLTMPGEKIKVLRRLNGALPYATFKSTIDGLLASQTMGKASKGKAALPPSGRRQPPGQE